MINTTIDPLSSYAESKVCKVTHLGHKYIIDNTMEHSTPDTIFLIKKLETEQVINDAVNQVIPNVA